MATNKWQSRRWLGVVGIYVGNTADQIRDEAARSFMLNAANMNHVLHTSGGAALATQRGDMAGLSSFGYKASSLDITDTGQRCHISESPSSLSSSRFSPC